MLAERNRSGLDEKLLLRIDAARRRVELARLARLCHLERVGRPIYFQGNSRPMKCSLVASLLLSQIAASVGKPCIAFSSNSGMAQTDLDASATFRQCMSSRMKFRPDRCIAI